MSIISYIFGKKQHKIQRDTQQSKILDPETYHKMEHRERTAHLIDAEKLETTNILTKMFNPQYNTFKLSKSLAIESDKISQFKMISEDLKTNRPFITISLFTGLWIPTSTETEAIITMYIKDDAYIDDNKRILLSRFRAKQVTNIVYKMQDYKAISDIGQLTLYVMIDNLDMRNTTMGTLRVLMLVKGSEDSLPRAKYEPTTIVLRPPGTENISHAVHNSIVDEIKDAYENDTNSYLKVLSTTLRKIDKNVLVSNELSEVEIQKPRIISMDDKIKKSVPRNLTCTEQLELAYGNM